MAATRGSWGYGDLSTTLRWLCAIAIAAPTYAASITPAFAVSAGCTAANGGAFNQNVVAGGANAVGIAGAFDQGDTLTITAAGNPNLATVQLLPSNTGIFGTAVNLVQTVTVNEAGVVGLGITVLASVGQAATLTITCVPVAAAAAPQASGTNSGAGTASTPVQTANAVDAATTAVTGNRLPTTPAALPGAGRALVARPQTRAQTSRKDHEALWEEFQNALNDLYVRDHEEQQQFLPDNEKRIDRFKHGISLFESGKPFPSDQDSADTRRGWTYGRARQAIIDRYRKRFEEAGLPMSDPRPQVELPEPDPDLDPDVDPDPEELGDGDIVLFRPDASGRGFSFELSSDLLHRHMMLKLEQDGAASAAPAPLTIAGMPVNIWARGRGTVFDRQKRAGSDGWAAHLLSGIALRVNESVTVGAFGSYLAARSDTDLTNTKVDTRQGGGGAYLRLAVARGLTLGLSASRETGEQDITTAAASGSADIDLWSVSSSVQGAVFLDPVLLSPSFAVTYAEFTRNRYTDSTGTVIPGSSSGDTTLTAALTASRAYRYEEGWVRRLTPRVSTSLNYVAREHTSYRVSATEIIDADTWSGNVGAGVTLHTQGSSRISFDAGVIGIGQDTLGYTGQLQVDFGF